MGKNKQKNKQKNKKNNGSAVILSCIRDCEKYIHTTIKNMQAIGEIFQEYSIFFYENDSKDKTLSILKEYELNHSMIHVISKPISSKNNILRTWRLGEARQTLLDNLKKINVDTDYVIVMDADDIANQVPFTGVSFIKEALKRKQHWDGCFPQLTYDLWAYRTRTNFANYWEINFLENMNIIKPNSFNYFKNNLESESKQFDTNNLQRVMSAFNGIGIYRYNVYCKGEYSGHNTCCNVLSVSDKTMLLKNNESLIHKNNRFYQYMFTRLNEECEHVSFHKSLGENIRLCCCNAVYYPSKNKITT